jgi:hypothetical protein
MVSSTWAYEFQVRSWKVQRVSWVLLYAVIVASMLGAFGRGGFFHIGGAGTESGGVEVRYERFGRIGTSSRLQVHLSKVARSGDAGEVAFSREFISDISLDGITPEPRRWATTPTELVLTYSGDERWLDVLYSPRSPGFLRVTVRRDDMTPVSFTQFIYP